MARAEDFYRVLCMFSRRAAPVCLALLFGLSISLFLGGSYYVIEPGHEEQVEATLRLHGEEPVPGVPYQIHTITIEYDKLVVRYRCETRETQLTIVSPRAECPNCLMTDSAAIQFDDADPHATLLATWVQGRIQERPFNLWQKVVTHIPSASANTTTGLTAWIWLLGWMLFTVAIAFLLLRQKSAAFKWPRVDKWQVVVALVLVGLVLAVRLPFALNLDLYVFELDGFHGLSEPIEVGRMTGVPVWQDPFHPPLSNIVNGIWLELGAVLGIGGELGWLRGANLALATVVVFAFLRIGRTLGAAWAGIGAALLFALLPEAILLSIYQGNYFLEWVVVVLFLQRLIVFVVEKREVYVTLALTAAACLWTGHMSALIVGPGMLLFLWVAQRRGQRKRALSTLLLLTLIYLPVANSTVVGVVTMVGATQARPPTAEENEIANLVYEHPAMNTNITGPLTALSRFPIEATIQLLGWGAALLAVIGGGVLLWQRPRPALFVCTVLLAYTLAHPLVCLRWQNLTGVAPFLIFCPLWGLGLLGKRWGWRIGAVGQGTFVVVALLISWSVGSREGEIVGLLRERPEIVSTAEITRFLQADERRDVPIVIQSRRPEVWYLLCAERATSEEVQKCLRSEVGDGYRWREIAGRQVLRPLTDISEQRLERPSVDFPHFLLTDQPVAASGCKGGFCSCREEMTSATTTLLFCG